MKQLGIIDSAFINLEQVNTPQHVGAMGIYDPSTAPGGFVRFKDVIAGFERRLNNLPLFRTRLVQVPGGRFYAVLRSGDTWRLTAEWQGEASLTLRPGGNVDP